VYSGLLAVLVAESEEVDFATAALVATAVIPASLTIADEEDFSFLRSS